MNCSIRISSIFLTIYSYFFEKSNSKVFICIVQFFDALVYHENDAQNMILHNKHENPETHLKTLLFD